MYFNSFRDEWGHFIIHIEEQNDPLIKIVSILSISEENGISKYGQLKKPSFCLY